MPRIRHVCNVSVCRGTSHIICLLMQLLYTLLHVDHAVKTMFSWLVGQSTPPPYTPLFVLASAHFHSCILHFTHLCVVSIMRKMISLTIASPPKAAESLSMNGRALNDRAIEVAPSSSRVSVVLDQPSWLLYDNHTNHHHRCSTVLPANNHRVAHHFSLLSHRRRTAHDLEIGHVQVVAFPISSVVLPASGVVSRPSQLRIPIPMVEATACRPIHMVLPAMDLQT
jgi:hypothetical protein